MNDDINDAYTLSVFSMKKLEYETLIESEISSASVVDHSKSPCEDSFIPEGKVTFYFQPFFNKMFNIFCPLRFKNASFPELISSCIPLIKCSYTSECYVANVASVIHVKVL